MRIYTPDYYASFRCIADRCRHSCCIGWEIDIDPSTHARYQNIGGDIGARLRENIEVTEDCASFRLDEHERCPFLNKQGLCDLIIELGEDSLCEICSEHPRFRNYFSSRCEIGLGLCCEEAARLVLTHESKAKLVSLSDDSASCELPTDEADFFIFRERVFDILQDRTLPIFERFNQVLAYVGIPSKSIFTNDSRWKEVYLSLERLDPTWEKRLEGWQTSEQCSPNMPILPAISLALEQLAVYFIYRHLADSLNDCRREVRVAFAILSCHVIATLAAIEGGSLASIIDIARSYSAEIEYSTENVDLLLDEIENG